MAIEKKYKYWAPKSPVLRGRERVGGISVSGRLKRNDLWGQKKISKRVFRLDVKKKKKVFQSGGKIDQVYLMLLTDKER